MSSHKIGMKMRQYDVFDLQAVFEGKIDVAIDVALRIDDGCGARFLVADDVRSMGKAIEIELLEDHERTLFEISKNVSLGRSIHWRRDCVWPGWVSVRFKATSRLDND